MGNTQGGDRPQGQIRASALPSGQGRPPLGNERAYSGHIDIQLAAEQDIIGY
jgi:hypothetical protein